MQPATVIRSFLRQLQRVERRRAWGLALLRVGAVLGLGVFGSLCVAAAGEPGDRLLPLTVAALACAVALHQLFVHGLRQHRALGDEVELARWVEARVPPLGSALVTAVELGLRSSPSAGTPSPALVEAVLANAAREVAGLVPGRLGGMPVVGAPPEVLAARQRRPLAPLLALAVTVLAVFASPGLLGTALAKLTHDLPPEEQDGGQWVDLAVSQLDLDIAPPAYARVAARTVPRSSGDVTALAGSTVTFKGVSLLPDTKEAALELASAPGERWSVEVVPGEPGAQLSGRLTVGDMDRYRFALLLEDGTIVRERTWRQVTAQPDAPPEVTLVLPEADLEVKPDDRLAFFFEATDDLGLRAVDLVARGSDGRELLRESARLAEGARVEKGHLTLEVTRLGLEAGEYADVGFEARDQRPSRDAAADAAATGRSAARRLTLYSPEAEHDAILALLDAVLEALVLVYADRVEHPLMAEEVRPWVVAAPHAEGIAKALEGILARLEEAIARLALDSEATAPMREGVRAARDRLEPNATHERALLARWASEERGLDAVAAATLMRDLNVLGIDDAEAAIFELKRLLDAARKDDVLEGGRELLATQDELMELLKKLKDNPDDATREQVLRKMKQLQAKMQRLRQELSKLQERSPYENQNPQQRPGERQTEMADMSTAMERVEDLLKEGKVDEAMKLLEELNQSTQSMMAGLQDDLERGGGRLGAAAARRQQAFSDELDAVAGQQEGLKGETSASAREAAKAAADRARAALDGVPLDGAAGAVKRAHDAASKAAQGLSEAARDGGPGMESAADRLSEALDGLAKELGQAARGARGDARQGLEAARDQAAGAARDARGGGEAGDSPSLERLRDAQARLRERLGKLGEQLSGLEQDTPGIGGELGPRLSEAAARMREAEAGLGKGQAREASARQQEALEQLKELQQAMEAREPKPGQEPGGEADGAGVNKDKVAIPKENKPGGARQLRAEILRAMQEETPDAWRDAVKRFYEELTR
jgi:hypothetical protein